MDLNALDVKLYLLINQGTVNGLFDFIMPFLSNKGYLLALPFGAYMILQALRQPADKRRETLILALWTIAIAVFSFLLADWLGNELKHYIRRIRPCHVLDGARLLGGCSQSFSMPSNHAINSFAYAVPLFFLTRGYIGRLWRFYPLILAGCVAYSRTYLGVHYPGDVTVGAILGCLSAAINITFFRTASVKYKEHPYTTLLYSSLFILAVFRVYYLLRGPLDLSPDEAGYWQMAGGTDVAWLTASPLLVCLISAGTALFGDTVFGIRIFALVLSLLSSYLMFRLAYNIYRDGAVALGSALLIQAIPGFSLNGTIMAPGSPLVFFWILSLGLFNKGLNGNHDKTVSSSSKLPAAWIMLGVAVGFGLLTSLTMALFPVGICIFLLMSDKKYLLKTVRPYASLIISLCILLTWMTLAGVKAVGPQPPASPIIQNLTALAGKHLLLVTPGILALIFFCLHQLFYKEYGNSSTFIFAFSIPVLALSFIDNITFDLQAGWSIAGYITGILAVACYFFRADKSEFDIAWKKNIKRTIIGAGIAMALFVTAILHFPMMLNMSLSTDPTLDRKGWRDLGREVSAIIEQQGEDAMPVIYSEDCRIASELGFYMKGHPKTYCAGPPGSYTSKGAKTIFIAEGDTGLPESANGIFEKADKKTIRITHKGRELKAYSVFICYNSRGPETGPIER
jgi:membrane-associated phospholipid phosphatase